MILLLAAAFTAGCKKKPKPVDAGVVPSESAEPSDSAAPAETAAPSDTVPPEVTETDDPAPDTTPEATPAPGDTYSPTATPKPTGTVASPVPSGTPTASPEPTFGDGPIWLSESKPVYFDLDLDGKAEKIEISLKHKTGGTRYCTVKVTLGSDGSVLVDTYEADSFINGLVCDYSYGDKRAELFVSTAVGKRYDTLNCYRINAAGNGLMKCSVDGWLDEVSSGGLYVSKYADIMGTWIVSAEHELDLKSFRFICMDEVWQVKDPSTRWCTLSDDIIVGFYVSGIDNVAGFMEAGSKLRPIATDLVSVVDFISDTEALGYISITMTDSGEAMYNGKTMDHWFGDLIFID